MSFDLTLLKGLKTEKSSPIKADLLVPPMVEGPVLAFDQSLAHTGWVYLSRDDVPMNYGTFTTEAAGGMVGNIERGTELAQAVRQVMYPFANPASRLAPEPPVIILETPPVLNATRRGESSLLAAQVIHLEAKRLLLEVRFVGAQRVKKRLTNSARASKREVKEALARRYDRDLRKYNQHVCDAWGLALVAKGYV